MKKFALFFVVFLAALIGLFLWIRGQSGPADPVRLLPEDTAFYAAFTDLSRSALRWKETTLARIAAEPGVAAFLSKPLAAFTGSGGSREAFEILSELQPSLLFVAAIPGGKSGFHLGLGFHFEGGRGAFDKAVARLRQQVAPKSPGPTHESTPDGDILVTELSDGTTLCSAAHGSWGLLSNHPDVLRRMLDRASGRSKAPSLAANPAFTRSVAHLPKEPDLVAFLQMGPLLDSLLSIASSVGAQPDPSQVAGLRQAKAAAFAFKMEGANLRDALFVLQDPPPTQVSSLDHSALNMTSSQTLGYFTFRPRYEILKSVLENPDVQKSLSSQVGDVRELINGIPEVLGPQVSLAFAWPADRMIPALLVSAGIRDAGGFQTVLERLCTLLPETTRTEKGGASLYTFPSLRRLFMDPVLAVSGNSVVVGLSPGDVEAAVLAPGGSGTLRDNPGFAAALPTVPSANDGFGFLDTKGVFERTFPLARQIAMLGSALLPGTSGFWDPTKIPPTETIARHLTPIVYSQTRLPEGTLLESSGPVTMDQATLVIAGLLLGPQILSHTR